MLRSHLLSLVVVSLAVGILGACGPAASDGGDGGSSADGGLSGDGGAGVDAGSGRDAGTRGDGGSDTDAGPGADAGPTRDGGPGTDGGSPADGGSGNDGGSLSDGGPGTDGGVTAGLWSSAAELATRPTSGPAWDDVLGDADDDTTAPDISNQDDPTNVRVLAAALVSARYSTDPALQAEAAAYRARVVTAIETVVAAGDPGGRTLAWAREVGAYALAADLVGYRTTALETWLRNMAEVYRDDGGETMLEMFRRRPNNWGTMAFGTLAAVYGFLGDDARLEEIRTWFVRGLEGPDPGYSWDSDRSWFCAPDQLFLVNPACTVDGYDFGGLIAEDQRRSGSYTGNPPLPDSHISGWINGAIMGARIYDRLGLPLWSAGNDAFLRMTEAHEVTFPQLALPDGKDWVLPIIDEAYGTSYGDSHDPATSTRPTASKNAGYGYFVVGP